MINDNDNNNDDNQLDEEWINNFENIEKQYDMFYKIKPTNIEIIYIYVDSDKEIEFIKKEDMILNNEAKILKSNLIYLINSNKIICEKKYKLLNVLKYNFTIEPIEILNNFKNLDNNNNYLHNITTIDDICFKDTIELFNELNTLYIIYADEKKIKQTTKKIFFNKHKNKNLGKTKRKRYKGF